MKNCTSKKCTQINPQPLSSFNKNKATKDGLSPQCKGCRSERWYKREKLGILVSLEKK